MAQSRKEIRKFINKHKYLFWYTPKEKKKDISEDLLVETILIYGNLDDIRKLFKIMGLKRVARIFRNLKGRQKLNYPPEIYNFFQLYFDRYVL